MHKHPCKGRARAEDEDEVTARAIVLISEGCANTEEITPQNLMRNFAAIECRNVKEPLHRKQGKVGTPAAEAFKVALSQVFSFSRKAGGGIKSHKFDEWLLRTKS